MHFCLQVSEDVLKMEPRLRCTKEKVGLLSKIVYVIKQEPFSASFRLVFVCIHGSSNSFVFEIP
jgi:hypothetical protein